VTAADKKRARKLFYKGLRAFARQAYPDALAHFNASYRLVKKNVVLYNIAMCHRALFQYTKAIAVFRQYLKRKARRGRPLPWAKRRRIKRYIVQMEKKLGRLKLLVHPKGATIRVDGRLVGRAPLEEPVPVDPGRRVVEISHPGHRTSTLSLNVASGQLVSMGVRLQPQERDGRLVLECSASRCRVRVDGGKPQQLPVTLSLRAGMHHLRVTAPGHLPQRLEVRVLPDETVRREVRLVPAAGAGGGEGGDGTPVVKTWWFWTVISAAVVAVGTTTGLVVWDQTRERAPRTDLTWRLP
jgi:hypothetical protein